MTASHDQSTGSATTGRDRVVRLAAGTLFVLGIVSAIAAISVLPGDSRQLLIAFAGVGLYGGTVLYAIRPAITDTVDSADRVYSALAATGEALQADFDLPEQYSYVPTETIDDGFVPVYLVVHAEGAFETARGQRPVIGEPDGGHHRNAITLHPTGAALFDACEELGVADLPADPVELGSQLAEIAVGGLEIASNIDTTVDPDPGKATISVRRPRFGPASRFDHPVASFLGVGFAHGLGVPVSMDAQSKSQNQRYRVTYRWDPTRLDR